MSASRQCEQCGRTFTPKRPHGRFDTQECRYQGWIEEDVYGERQRVTDGVGSRGGNVRSVEEARSLHQTHKPDWVEKVSNRITDMLLTTGHFHADDLDVVGVPPDHANVKSACIGGFSSAGLMEKTGVERKVAHPAANGRKAAIFRITAKGQRELGAADRAAA